MPRLDDFPSVAVPCDDQQEVSRQNGRHIGRYSHGLISIRLIEFKMFIVIIAYTV